MIGDLNEVIPALVAAIRQRGDAGLTPIEWTSLSAGSPQAAGTRVSD